MPPTNEKLTLRIASCAVALIVQVPMSALASAPARVEELPVNSEGTVVLLAPFVVEAERDRGDRIYGLDDVDVRPVPKGANLAYPPTRMLREPVGSSVIVSFIIDEKGRTTEVKARKATLFDCTSYPYRPVTASLINLLVEHQAIRPVALSMSLAEVRAGIAVEYGDAAEASIRDWTFEPALKDGKPVKVRLTLPVIYFRKDGERWDAFSRKIQ